MSYVEVLGDKSTVYISVTLSGGYLTVLLLFHLLCILNCGCYPLCVQETRFQTLYQVIKLFVVCVQEIRFQTLYHVISLFVVFSILPG